MNRKTKIIVIVCAAILVVALGVFAALQIWGQRTTTEGLKTITVEVVFADGSAKTYEITTEAEYLRQALEQKNLIAGDESALGLFVTSVDGIKADDAQQQWWKFSKNGEGLLTGVDTTPIADGDHFEITLVTGYDDLF